MTILSRMILVTSICIFLSCSAGKRSYTYLDETGEEITRGEFRKKLNSKDYLEINTDSQNEKKLVYRTNFGKMENLETFQNLLVNRFSQKPDFSKPVVIIYYPGEDQCNKAISNANLKWYQEMEAGLEKRGTNIPLYLYKNNAGSVDIEEWLSYTKDPGGIVEKTFFNQPYPCASFVSISAEGNYVTYYGEFPKEFVWDSVDKLREMDSN